LEIPSAGGLVIVVGIDVGKDGGVCALLDGQTPWKLFRMPATYAELGEFFVNLNTYYPGELRVYMEELSVNPIFSRTAIMTSARGIGTIEGLLTILDVPYKLVRPQTWQNLMYDHEAVQSIPGGGKARSFAACKLLCPGINLVPPGCRVEHDGMADAYLIARYGVCQLESKEV
jgi:hypothetical protein